MQVNLFFCKHADTNSDGQLNMQGIFNELYAPGFPARQDLLVLAGVIEWDKQQQGKIPFQVHLADAQGKAIFTVDGHSEVDSRSADQAPAKTLLALPLENLVFPEQGRYEATCVIDGEKIAGPSLYLQRSS